MKNLFANTGYKKSDLLESVHDACIELMMQDGSNANLETVRRLNALYHYISDSEG